VRLWDSLFADPSRFELATYLSAAMVEAQAERLRACSFGQAVQLLQQYPPPDARQEGFEAGAVQVGGGGGQAGTARSPVCGTLTTRRRWAGAVQGLLQRALD
jgi:hypothetical protein